jgi:NTP pyrophosphatase (non-canonical NTP hydrolase)
MTPHIQNLSLSKLQGMIDSIYGQPNDRNFETRDLVTQMGGDIGTTLKYARKGQTTKLPQGLAMSLAWALAIAVRLHIDLGKELWEQYPNACPYCGTKPCSCRGKRADKRICVKVPKDRPRTFRECQQMLKDIYPENTLEDSGRHLAEEAFEVSKAVMNFNGRHSPKLFKEIRLELIDVIANIIGVANCAEIDLAETMAKVFEKGCPVCHHNACRCMFSTVAESKPV